MSSTGRRLHCYLPQGWLAVIGFALSKILIMLSCFLPKAITQQVALLLVNRATGHQMQVLGGCRSLGRKSPLFQLWPTRV